MAKFSKEELRKKLEKERSEKKKTKNEPKLSKVKKEQRSSNGPDLSRDLKRLGLISLITIVLLAVSIYIKNQTIIFDQVADFFYQLIN